MEGGRGGGRVMQGWGFVAFVPLSIPFDIEVSLEPPMLQARSGRGRQRLEATAEVPACGRSRVGGVLRDVEFGAGVLGVFLDAVTRSSGESFCAGTIDLCLTIEGWRIESRVLEGVCALRKSHLLLLRGVHQGARVVEGGNEFVPVLYVAKRQVRNSQGFRVFGHVVCMQRSPVESNWTDRPKVKLGSGCFHQNRDLQRGREGEREREFSTPK
jgi:hypothetical protein